MDQNDGVQSHPPIELLFATAKAVSDDVIKKSVIIFNSGQLGNELTYKSAKKVLSFGSILRKDVTTGDYGRTSPTSPSPKIKWADDLSDGSERSWNQSSPDSSFPFAVHPRCEDLIREDKNVSAAVHPRKSPDRTAGRFVRMPSPLSADFERSSPAPSPVLEETKRNTQSASGSTTSTKMKKTVIGPKDSMTIMKSRPQRGPFKFPGRGICSQVGLRRNSISKVLITALPKIRSVDKFNLSNVLNLSLMQVLFRCVSQGTEDCCILS